MKHYGIWLKDLNEWMCVDDTIFWTTSKGVAHAQLELLLNEEEWRKVEVREFPES